MKTRAASTKTKDELYSVEDCWDEADGSGRNEDLKNGQGSWSSGC